MSAGWLDALMTQAIVGDSVEMKLGTQVLADKHLIAEVEVVDRRAASIERIELLLNGAVDRGARPAVIDGYEKLLKQLTS